jgi:hypothetical protein
MKQQWMPNLHLWITNALTKIDGALINYFCFLQQGDGVHLTIFHVPTGEMNVFTVSVTYLVLKLSNEFVGQTE